MLRTQVENRLVSKVWMAFFLEMGFSKTPGFSSCPLTRCKKKCCKSLIGKKEEIKQTRV